ncbi:hypothetical protein CASFOL_001838 [Castilleja foliolosa]|uniref:DUF1985 domain-containing protein n=1 Tax=Castilleja foliolosa TaxID=1961234 RepID=A0ABD3ECX4_9LAMI
MASADNNNMAIEVYQPSQVGETDAANPTNAVNPTIAADSNPANAADSTTTISNNNNVDSTTGREWRWPEIRFPELKKKTSILLDVRTESIKEFQNRLGDRNLDLFRESCFGAYLNYPKNQVIGTVMHLMLSQQVIKEGADEDELWFLVGDKFVRFSKYEYALVTGLRFGPTSFDPNEDCDIPTEGVYRKFIDPENKFSRKGAEYGDKWETFPWGAYTFQILMMRMKNAKVKPQNNYHIYRFSHAFMVVPGLADIITSKPKHKCVQPRLLKRLFKKKPLAEYLNFFDKQTSNATRNWNPQSRSSLITHGGIMWTMTFDHPSNIFIRSPNYLVNATETPLKWTREQFPVPARGQGDGSVPMVETRSPDNSAPAEERKTPPPPAEEDDLYVSFDGNFIDDIEAFADSADFVRCRGDREPESTPIRRLPVLIGKYLTLIKVSRAVVKKQQAKTPLFNIRRAIRPPKDFDAKTYIIDRTSKHMSVYIAYLESDSKEARDTGTGMCQYDDASYFKKVEDPNLWMDIHKYR